MQCDKRAGDPVWHDVFKDPITDKGKRSKRSIQALVQEDGQFKSIRHDSLGGMEDLLEPVWKNGKLLRDQSFAEVRALSDA